jgi:hypothetical protein
MKIGCRVDVCHIEAFSLDIDLPEDLDLFRQIENLPGDEKNN